MVNFILFLVFSEPNRNFDEILIAHRSDNITKTLRSIIQCLNRIRNGPSENNMAYSELCARIAGVMLKPTRHVTTGARSVNTSPVPSVLECDEEGVYRSMVMEKPVTVVQMSSRPNRNGNANNNSSTQTTSVQERLSGKRGLIRDKVQTTRRDLCARQVRLIAFTQKGDDV